MLVALKRIIYFCRLRMMKFVFVIDNKAENLWNSDFVAMIVTACISKPVDMIILTKNDGIFIHKPIHRSGSHRILAVSSLCS